jgi:hypothetical protein
MNKNIHMLLLTTRNTSLCILCRKICRLLATWRTLTEAHWRIDEDHVKTPGSEFGWDHKRNWFSEKHILGGDGRRVLYHSTLEVVLFGHLGKDIFFDFIVPVMLMED